MVNSIEFPDRQTAYQFEESVIQRTAKSPFASRLANISLNARAGDNLTRHPDKDGIVERRTETQKTVLRNRTPEERKELFGRPGALNGMYGRTHTDETRKRISENNMGHSYNKGCKLSAAHIEKIRERAKKYIGNKNPFFGRHHTQETLDKIREALIGLKPPSQVHFSAEGKEFFLYVGSLQNINNLINLLKAFSFFKKRQKSNMQLVIVANFISKNNEFVESLKTYKYRNEVRFLENIPIEESTKITSTAYAFVYVPLYDDFPIILPEVMKCNIPAIVSDTESLHEISSDAALYTNPSNHEDIADKMMIVFKDENNKQERY